MITKHLPQRHRDTEKDNKRIYDFLFSVPLCLCGEDFP